MPCVKTNPDAVFGWGFHPKMAPLFLLEADPKTISENGSLKNHHFHVYKIAKKDLPSENANFLLRTRYYERWPKFKISKPESRNSLPAETHQSAEFPSSTLQPDQNGMVQYGTDSNNHNQLSILNIKSSPNIPEYTRHGCHTYLE